MLFRSQIVTLAESNQTEAVDETERSDALAEADSNMVSAEADQTEQGALNASDDPDVIVSKMTMRQKIAQCLMIDFRKWNDKNGKEQDMTVLDTDVADILSEYQFGSVILFAENIKETGETLALTKDLQKAVINGGGLPLLIATDQEGGIVYRLGSGTALPGNMALGATGDTKNAELAGEIIGSELEAVGINTSLAPVLDVNSNANNPIIGIRSFGDDPEAVGSFGSAYISGLGEYNIIGCAKHYPGHGDTDTDSHTGLPVVNKSLDELMKQDFVPFQTAIDQGVDMIMTAHIVYPQIDSTKIKSTKTGEKVSRPATLSSKFLSGILRYKMDYDGVVVTDAMNMQGISDYLTEDQAVTEALRAGADLICMPVTGVYEKKEFKNRIDTVIGAVESAVESGVISEDRLDEAVTRIIRLKQKRGILDYNEDNYTAERAYSTVGSAENRALERDIAAKAVTLIRNDNNVLPYKAGAGANILMLSPYANETAQMVMGFNRAKAAGKLPADADVRVFLFQGHDGKIEGDIKEALDWADLVIIGSELYGASDMAYGGWRSKIPKAATEYCKAEGKKSVVMSLNTPYDVQLYPDADAVLAVYGWKGSSADVDETIKNGTTEIRDACGPNIIAGVEVALGVYSASGKLPVNIPAFDSESSSFISETVYARGYGLTYLGKPSIKSAKAGSKKITVTASKAPALFGGTKYQLAYKLKGSSKWKYKTTSKKTITVSKLKKGKKYTVRIRTMNSTNGQKYYGKWSKSKTVKVK